MTTRVALILAAVAVGMKPGDVAGLALLNLPNAWIGIKRDADMFTLEHFDQATGRSREVIQQPRLKLRVHCDFDTDTAQFSSSINGREFKPIGDELKLPFQLKTFQGVRYALFHYNTGGSPGGHADFGSFTVDEPRPRGLSRPIPIGQRIAFEDIGSGNVLALVDGSLQSIAGSPTIFRVVDRSQGRIALQTASSQYLSVGEAGVGVTSAKPTDAETFQWVDLQRGDMLLLSLKTHRYLVAPKRPGPVTGDHPGPANDRKDGSCFRWKVVK
jgi:xylan 1,4-beta-xylosidase